MKTIGLVAITALLCPSIASATTRVAIVIDEYVDGQAQESSIVTALSGVFEGDDDVVLIDPAQAAVVRETAAGTPLSQIAPSKLVTAVDADKLIVGEVRMAEKESPFKGLTVYEGRAILRVVAVDTAQIDGFIDELAIGRAVGRAKRGPHIGAVRDVVGQLVSKVGPRIKKLVSSRGPGVARRLRVKVALASPLDVAATQTVKTCVAKVANAKEVEVVVQNKTEIILMVKTPRPALDFAQALSEPQSCPLFVHAFSQREVQAEYRIRSRTTLAASYFKPRGARAKKHQWLAREFPSVVGVSLTDIDFIDADGTVQSRKKAVKRGRRKLALVGSYSVSGDAVNVEAEVRATWRNQVLASKAMSCALSRVGSCAIALGETLAGLLPNAIAKNLRALPLDKYEHYSQPNPVVMDLSKIDQIYPSRYGYYYRQGLGPIDLKNTGPTPVESVLVSGDLVGFGAGMQEAKETITLGPNETRSVWLKLSLKEEKLRAVSDRESTILKVGLKYRSGDYEYRHDDRSVGVMVLDRNALDWSDPQSVAAFVTPLQVTKLTQKATKATHGRTKELPVALFHLLTKLNYAHDPVNPWSPQAIDQVFYPRETLAKGQGDCDDLAVLYASMLEAAGIPSILIVTPGHVLVGVDTTFVADIVPSPAGKDAFLDVLGRRWIPVETTRLDGTFDDAWRAAAERMKSVSIEDRQFVSVRRAWSKYPSKDLAPRGLQTDIAFDGSALKTLLEQRRLRRKAAFEARTAELKKVGTSDAENELGILYAQFGALEEADRHFTKSLGIKTSLAAQNNLGNLRVLRGEEDTALIQYTRALKADQTHLRRIEVIFNAIVANGRLNMKDVTTRKRRAKLYDQAFRLDADRFVAFLERLPSGKVTARDGAHVDLARVGDEMRRFLKDRGVAVAQTKAGRVADEQLDQYLHWID